MLNLYAFGFGAPVEWIVIGAVVLVIFGPKKLPEFARSLGKSVGELKKGLDETKETFNSSLAAPAETVEAEKKPTTTTPAP
jgi:TatA/E family protein of Tat protein translocase